MSEQNLAIKVFSTQSLGFKPVLSQTSLIIPDGTPFEAVEQMLEAMKSLRNCTLWWIGDALLYAERAFGEKYSQLLDASDFEYSTLRNVSYITAHVAPNVRRKEITFWHHQEVAQLPQEDQKKFLKIAVDQKLTAAALRALIKNKDKDPKPNRAETYELALKSILKIAKESPDFSKEEFTDRAGKIPEVVMIAITAFDALHAFED